MMRLAGQFFIVAGIACIAFGLFGPDVFLGISMGSRTAVTIASLSIMVSGWVIYLLSGRA